MTSKIKNRLISRHTLHDGLKPEIVSFTKDAVLYNKNTSHLHKFKAQPIADGNRAERREAAKQMRKEK